MDAYYAAIDEGRIPVFRGVELSADDILRRDVITQLICHFELSFQEIESAHNIRFTEYFAQELTALEQMQRDGLVSVSADFIHVLPKGRLLIRNICMVFDFYLRQTKEQRFSKVI